jgi:hypothetical protein
MLDIGMIMDPHARAQWLYAEYTSGRHADDLMRDVADASDTALRALGTNTMPEQMCTAVSGTLAVIYLFAAVTGQAERFSSLGECAWHAQHALRDHADTPDPMVVAVFEPCEYGDANATAALNRLSQWVTGELSDELASEALAYVAANDDGDSAA